jgi:hypothetical protein
MVNKMNKQRIFKVAALSAVLGTVFTAGVYAEDVLRKVEAYLRPDFTVVVDGKQVQLEGPTLIYDGSSYLPLKELGNMLGASILWRGDTKTIYINSRTSPEQPKQDPNVTYEEITMNNPYGVIVSYLGAEYPVLLTYAEKSQGLFWRESDVRKMMSTEGLKKVREKLTQDLFISEQELRLRWKQPPQQSYSPGKYFIAGEINPKKVEALRNYLEDSTNGPQKVKDVTFNTRPLTIFALPEEDMYEYLYQQSAYFANSGTSTVNRYFRAKLKLHQNIAGEYDGVNMMESLDLQSEADDRAAAASMNP